MYDSLGYDSKNLGYAMSTFIGGSVNYINDYIYYAPYVYNGVIARIDIKKNKVNYIRSERSVDSFYEINEESDKISGRNKVTSRGILGDYTGYLNEISAGIYEYKDKYLLHFINREKVYDEEKYFFEKIVEIYSKEDYKYIGKSNVYNYDKKTFPSNVIWSNGYDRYSIYDNDNMQIKVSTFGVQNNS